jgi:polysaccharide biosynthesis transport protein
MSDLATRDHPPTVAHYLGVLRRRKWLAVLPLVLIPTLAFLFSSRQSALYQATAQVLLNRQDVVSAAAQVNNPILFLDPSRLGLTQAKVARSPLLARRVVAAAHVPGLTAAGFLSNSNVSANPTSDVLEFSTTGRDPDTVARLANVYARQYSIFSHEIAANALDTGVKRLEEKIRAAEASGGTNSRLYKQLVAAQTKLEIAAALETGNTVVLRPAGGSAQIAPRPMRSALLGGLLGLVLGMAFAFLAESLDKRVRNESEIEERLGVPLLGRIARPPRRLRKSDELVMVAEPATRAAETFRRLRGTIDFVDLQHRAGLRAVMFTSATQREGKSTTVANLAVAYARAGRRVALVDLDLRRPFLHTFFDLDSSRGFADVAVDRVPLESAIRALALRETGTPTAPAQANGSSSGSSGRSGIGTVLNFLPSGTTPPAVGEFLLDERVANLLAELRDEFDLVLVDAPPLLAVGDSTTLSAAVDAIVLVVGSGIRRPLLHELARELRRCRATVLGFILTGPQHGDSYDPGYYGADLPDLLTRTERVEQAP